MVEYEIEMKIKVMSFHEYLRVSVVIYSKQEPCLDFYITHIPTRGN